MVPVSSSNLSRCNSLAYKLDMSYHFLLFMPAYSFVLIGKIFPRIFERAVQKQSDQYLDNWKKGCCL